RRSMAARVLRLFYLTLGLLLCVITVGSILYGQTGLGLHRMVRLLQMDHRGTELCSIIVTLLIGGGGVVALVCASGVVAEEREGQALPLLRLSRMSAAEIMAG